MHLQLLVILAILFSNSECSIIDVSSIQVIHDLYRLCWKQLGDGKLDHLKSRDGDKFAVFQDHDSPDNTYCVEKQSPQYDIVIPIGNSAITLHCKFNKPHNYPTVEIQKKVVSGGVYFQIDFGKKNDSFCTCLLIYGPQKDKLFNNICRQDPSAGPIIYYVALEPGTPFSILHYCYFSEYLYTFSKFVTDQGTIFPEEKIYPLQPFLQLPFMRYLVGQWKNPNYVPEIYEIVIYQIFNSTDEICVKIFNLYSSFIFTNHHVEPMSNCNKSVPVEDLGIFHSNGNDSIHFVLDMVEPLRLNTRYKLSILWMNEINEMEENFIYFEPSKNENYGNINRKILNFNQQNYTEIRNIISPMNHNEDFNKYPPNITESQSIHFLNSTELVILQSVDTNQYPIERNDSESGYYHKKCEEIPHCGQGPHPFFYLMTKTESYLHGNYLVELITIPKREMTQNISVNISCEYSTASTSEISWNINSDRKTNIPSLFVVLIREPYNDECVSMYIVTCQTCNKMHQQISEYNSGETLKKWKENCKNIVRQEDLYTAMSSSITINMTEMVPVENFKIEIYAINLNTARLFGRSKSNHNNPLKSFWSRHRTILMIVIFVLIGLLLLIGLIVAWRMIRRNNR